MITAAFECFSLNFFTKYLPFSDFRNIVANITETPKIQEITPPTPEKLFMVLGRSNPATASPMREQATARRSRVSSIPCTRHAPSERVQDDFSGLNTEPDEVFDEFDGFLGGKPNKSLGGGEDQKLGTRTTSASK